MRPDVVVLGEPTDLDVFRGHRGRLEVDDHHPRRLGPRRARRARRQRALRDGADHRRTSRRSTAGCRDDAFLGKGSVIVSYIDCTTPSLNAVPDGATIVLDRRHDRRRDGRQRARRAARPPPPRRRRGRACCATRRRAGTAAPSRQDKFYPTWVLDEGHPLVQGVAAAAAEVLGRTPAISRWHFSTNGVATHGPARHPDRRLRARPRGARAHDRRVGRGGRPREGDRGVLR